MDLEKKQVFSNAVKWLNARVRSVNVNVKSAISFTAVFGVKQTTPTNFNLGNVIGGRDQMHLKSCRRHDLMLT